MQPISKTVKKHNEKILAKFGGKAASNEKDITNVPGTNNVLANTQKTIGKYSKDSQRQDNRTKKGTQ